ncbi:MAG: phosphoribosyltransferase [Actinomycetia bacterium]|nr:phosphoribosyltransferase [Actinomycetes bacterium]
MSTLIEDRSLMDKLYVFKDRREAGRRLARKLMRYKGSNTMVMAIPAGGVPVADEIAKALQLPAELVIVRKIQLPDNPEAGFGAVGPYGEMILNEPWVAQLHLAEYEIIAQKKKTIDNIKKRDQIFRKGRPYLDLKGKTVILVDDGMASGYTMLAAIGFTRRLESSKVITAVPTASNKTVDFILPQVDELVCLNVRRGYYFAVADAYKNWYDLDDEEVLSIIGREPFDY